MNDKNKVLIIDDDSLNIFALKAVLTSKGYRCVTATSALEGIRMIQADEHIGVVLMDIMMPEMDGYESIEHIRKLEQGGDIPLVAVTGLAMADDRQKCLDAGADDYLSKPINVPELETILGKYVQRDVKQKNH